MEELHFKLTLPSTNTNSRSSVDISDEFIEKVADEQFFLGLLRVRVATNLL